MSITREEIILEELDLYKWPKEFVCLRCGNKNYNKGEELYSRRCSNPKCKRDVSLKKYTAFEGVRFPIEKAYGILETLTDTSFLDPDKKVILVKRTEYEKDDEPLNPFDSYSVKGTEGEFMYISMCDFIARGRRNRMSEDNINKRLEITLNKYRPSISSLSQKFEVEENTVRKFIEKVANRIVPDHTFAIKDPLQRLVSFIGDKNGTLKLSYLIGMVTVPLVGKWQFGITLIDRKAYAIRPMPEYKEGRWSVYRVKITDENGRFNYDYYKEYRYGSDEWYQLFHDCTDRQTLLWDL